MHPRTPLVHDRASECKVVSLLALGLGMVGLDRFIINPLFPVMQKELGLGYQDLGLISAALALTWGAASIVSGRVADRVGPRRVLIAAMAIFSVLVATTGFATGLCSLLVIRAVMGFAEGAYVPASIVATVNASKPSRVGLNIGLQQMAQPLVGLGLGPIVAVGLLKVLPSWHFVFAAVAVPGLLLAAVMVKVLRDPARVAETPRNEPHEWRAVALHGAVRVNMAAMLCYLTCVITLSAFMPSYLTDYLRLNLDQMGLVLTGQGVGSLVGMVIIPALSDRFGRKPMLIAALLVQLAALCVLRTIGAEPVKLFAALFVITFMNSGAIAITVGPLTSAAVPARLAASATGLVVGVGEIVGGAFAPAAAGALAHAMGIAVIPVIALVATAAGAAIVALGVREPGPSAHIEEHPANTLP
ncbi:MFS transporter [Burkholderia gladioli]|uniref:MFS transporter n=1 Tax=Burkholderia gladioli TaxID=28095 RepID=UPI0003A34C83|nr:MFS transporter [Burkholderia gladioli]MBU9172104.1 MFS transporter [Burkholderia gladioli]MBU9179341.1 MFS transporter [Burkholderia gladioli]MBU9218475.1 MFS transporter [Burkholderia gladioli]MBU9384333.1 MFS transporter [Burkholderia gladioli]MDN7728039.1 MFS transporter [Burkholderia gladioli]